MTGASSAAVCAPLDGVCAGCPWRQDYISISGRGGFRRRGGAVDGGAGGPDADDGDDPADDAARP